MKTLIPAGLVLLVILFGLQVAPKAGITQSILMGLKPPTGGGGGGGGGGSTACVVGPPYKGTIPPQAATVGFTTCLLNMDFSDSTAFTFGGDIAKSWTNIPSWLDCRGASPAIMTLSSGTCSEYTIITDADGKTSLANDATQADLTANGMNYTASITQIGTSWDFPNNIYFEQRSRMDTNTVNNPPQPTFCCIQVNEPFWGAAIWGFHTGSNRNWIEWDLDEWYLGNPSSGNHNNPGAGEWPTDSRCGVGHSCPLTTPADFNTDFTVYHDNGLRVTADTAGNFGTCWYLDGSQNLGGHNGCANNAALDGPTDTAFTNLNYFTFPWNNFKCCAGVTFTSIPVPVRSIARRIIIFTCSTWQTTICNTGVFTGTP